MSGRSDALDAVLDGVVSSEPRVPGLAAIATNRSRQARIHARTPDGGLEPMDFELPPDPDLHMAGYGLYGTTDDSVRFIRMWLNDGHGPDGEQVLKEGTAVYDHALAQT